MLIICPACQASYEIPDHLLVNAPVRLRCARCSAEWAWSGAKAYPEEKFELPDLFAPGPLSQAPPVHETQDNFKSPILLEPVPVKPILADPALADPALAEPALDEPILAEPTLAGPSLGEPMAAESEQAREPIGSPVFHLSQEPSLPPLTVERSPPRRDRMIEIPQMPVSKAPSDIAQDAVKEHALSREDIFRRIIEANRQRGLKPETPSRRPQLIAILALIVLIALFLGAHFVMVNAVTAGPAG